MPWRLGCRSAQVSGRHARIGLHSDAAVADTGSGFLRRPDGLGRRHTGRPGFAAAVSEQRHQWRDFNDFLPPTFKTAVFGLIIGLDSCFQGMRTKGGTEGVGRSATSAVVLSSLFIILADVVLVRFILVFFP